MGLVSVLYEIFTESSDFLRDRIDVPFHAKRKMFRRHSFPLKRVGVEVDKIRHRVLAGAFRPDAIVGIGGATYVGGIVVGALLASRSMLDKPFATIDVPGRERNEFRPEPSSLGHVHQWLAKGRLKQILLVDDVVMRGDTISGLVEALASKGHNRSNIRIATILRYSPELVAKQYGGDEPLLDESYWNTNICNYVTKHAHVSFPWKVIIEANKSMALAQNAAT